MKGLPHNFGVKWREAAGVADSEMSSVRGEYLVADGLRQEDAVTIAVAPEAIAALYRCVKAWERLFPLFPVDQRVEDVEFEEFLVARSILARAARPLDRTTEE
jgi:hypothetical protein